MEGDQAKAFGLERHVLNYVIPRGAGKQEDKKETQERKIQKEEGKEMEKLERKL